MSKFAMMALSYAIRQAAFADGVRSLALCPGYVATDMTAQAPLPQEEMTRPENLARLVALIVQLPKMASISERAAHCAYEATI